VELEPIYRREMASVYALLFRLGAPKADLPDLVQDVFVTAMRRWSTYDARRPIRPWLMGIAWRVASDYRARKKPELFADLPDQADDVSADASLEARDAQRLVQRALGHLDETKRAAFVMHTLEGLSVAEISDAMEAPAQTTYSRLRAAREEFATALRRVQRGEA
jgi:RNA polymerase sigma factor (sigma-70 family)